MHTELEQIVLGACLSYRGHIDKLNLTAEDFEYELHQKLFSTMVDCVDQYDDISPQLLASMLNADNEVFEYLKQLWLKGYSTLSVKPYANEVAKQSLLRKRKKVISDALEDTTKLDALSEDLQDIEVRDSSAIIFQTSAALYKNLYNHMEVYSAPYSTGLAPIDNAMQGGLYSSKTYCIAARPKVGKTVTLATISHNLNKAGVKHVYIAAEMSAEEIAQRYVAYDLGRNPVAFRENSEDFKRKVAEYAVQNATREAIFVNSPSISFYKLKKTIINAHKRGVKGVILDYLQLVTGKDKSESEAQFQATVAQWLAEIAKRLNIFILYAAQLNRDGELRGSDGIKMAVDQLYLMQGEKIGEVEHRWFSMEATRYTPREDIGAQGKPLLRIAKLAPVLEVA